MRSCFGIILVQIAFATSVVGQTADIEDALRSLGDESAEARLEGLHGLSFSLDPRIPDAVLPLLHDESFSVRVWAARAVGSRWWQIPSSRADGFVKALKKCAASEEVRENSMGLRGIGLLKRDYGSSSFACSPDKRWVVYERFSCPCVIDTKNFSEELIGWRPDGAGASDGRGGGCGFTPVWNRSTVHDEVWWHPDSKRFGFSTGFGRYGGWVCVWQQGKGLVELRRDDVAKALKASGVEELGQDWWIKARRWRGNLLEFEYMDPSHFSSASCTLAWDPDKGAVSLLSAVPRDEKSVRP